MIVPSFSLVVAGAASKLLWCQVCLPAVASVQASTVSDLVLTLYGLGHSPYGPLLCPHFQITSLSPSCSFSANIYTVLGGIRNISCCLVKTSGNICMPFGPVSHLIAYEEAQCSSSSCTWVWEVGEGPPHSQVLKPVWGCPVPLPGTQGERSVWGSFWRGCPHLISRLPARSPCPLSP